MNRAELPQMYAAGGLVRCGDYALLIRKHRLWDLPKGKRDYPEEPYEQCALREIAEETGLRPGLLTIRAPLLRSTYISYYAIGPVNKTVQWFLLDYGGDLCDPLQPDVSEGIDQCRWVELAQLADTLRAARPYLRPVRMALAQGLLAPAARPG